MSLQNVSFAFLGVCQDKVFETVPLTPPWG